MKTTLDLPDDILHKAKVIAAQRKITLKELVLRGLEQVLKPEADDKERQKVIGRLVTAMRGRNVQRLKPLARAEIYER